MELKDRLKNLLSASGKTQTEVAKALKMSNSSLSDIINGKYIPTTKTVAKFSEYFNVSTDFLIKGE